jgi:hypothetical protein
MINKYESVTFERILLQNIFLKREKIYDMESPDRFLYFNLHTKLCYSIVQNMGLLNLTVQRFYGVC